MIFFAPAAPSKDYSAVATYYYTGASEDNTTVLKRPPNVDETAIFNRYGVSSPYVRVHTPSTGYRVSGLVCVTHTQVTVLIQHV